MKKRLLFLMVASVSLTAATAHAQLAATANPFCDTFFDTLNTSQATTVDAFLADFTLKPNITNASSAKALMYHSRAMHGTSFQNPRALIMYGLSDLVVAFNGSPDHNAYDTLEIMCYNRHVGEFQFRAIQFLAESKPGGRALSEIEIENSRFRMTKANPDSCKQCHNVGTSGITRPAWQTYLAWAGTYGSYEEAYNLPAARFAQDSTEYQALMDFKKSVLDGKLRYNRFYWGGSGAPNLATSNNAFFGILLNYKMANAAIRSMLQTLSTPEHAKYKYAFAGYLLNCDENFMDGDSNGDLRSLRAEMATERARFEIRQRLNLNQDLALHATRDLGRTDEVRWRPRHDDAYPIDTRAINLSSYPDGLAAMVARVSRVTPDWLVKLSRFENLYNKMGISTEGLHLGDPETPNSKTSWDGYNEVQDYMADYLYKYYNLPSITHAQQLIGEEISARSAGVAVVHRTDLMTRVSDEDYATVVGGLDALELPRIQGDDKRALCRTLSNESLRALGAR